MNTPAVITSKMMWEELQIIKSQIAKLTKNTLTESIQEISFLQTCKILKLGKQSVLRLIDSGELKARKYKDAKGKIRYRIRLIDLKEFQEFTRANEEAINERKQEEERVLRQRNSKASADYMAWAKDQVEIAKAKRDLNKRSK
jgi:hypothetical protein